MLAQLERLPAPWRRALAVSGPDDLPIAPDSALARAAHERVEELSAPWLHAHCMRTWAFSALLARTGGVAHDPELLYLACVLHDLGLAAPHDRDPAIGCFAVEGARAAHAFVCDHGGSGDRALVVAEAITLHLNVTVPARLGAEASLLSRGVSLDVVGRHADRLPAAGVARVEQRWPRDGLAGELIATTVAQARARPQSRSALLHRLGFARLVRANPLDRDRLAAAA
ncbi:MAG: HD domain-containing protein [Solirubrobacteraceae bacterium]